MKQILIAVLLLGLFAPTLEASQRRRGSRRSISGLFRSHSSRRTHSTYRSSGSRVSYSGGRGRGNHPCSGRKGGVARCAGKKFVCNDGSISKSKYSCS